MPSRHKWSFQLVEPPLESCAAEQSRAPGEIERLVATSVLNDRIMQTTLPLGAGVDIQHCTWAQD